MTLCSETICVIECRTLSAFEREHLDVVGGMTCRAERACLRGMNGLDVLVRVFPALILENDFSSEMARRAWILTQVSCSRAQ